jgi:hypothetical protein
MILHRIVKCLLSVICVLFEILPIITGMSMILLVIIFCWAKFGELRLI